MTVLVDSRGNPLARAPAEPEARSDGWSNDLTGIGTWGDKSIAGRFGGIRRISDQELTNLNNGSSIAAKLIEKVPQEMFRSGYELECDDVKASACNDLKEWANEELNVDAEFLEAQTLANLYGGYLLVLGADDGGLPEEPLDETRIRNFAWVNGIDRRFAYALDYYSEPGPKYGKPRLYLTSNAVTASSYGYGSRARIRPTSQTALERAGYYTSIIHESRCIRFDGVTTDRVTMQTLAGWSWSVLQRIYDGLRRYEHAFDSVSFLLSDASQAVFTLKGMIAAISAGKMSSIRQRMEFLEQTRSVMRGVVLDDGETFERHATPFGGIADVLDKVMLRFAADADMPVTEIFGRAASGLNAAAGADAETRKWYDKIDSKRKTELAPKKRRFFRIASLAADCPVKLPAGKNGKPLAWEIAYKPLYAPSDEELEKTRLATAQRDQIYCAEGVVTPEEVALDRQDLYPSMDVDAREAAKKGAVAFDPYENDEPDVPPPGTVPPGAPGAPPGGVPPVAGAVPPAAPAVAPPPAKKPAAKTAKGPALAKTKPKPTR